MLKEEWESMVFKWDLMGSSIIDSLSMAMCQGECECIWLRAHVCM